MRKTICAVLMVLVLATQAFAARVYLKEGGYIQANKVWKNEGKVYVLVNHETLATFATSEVDMNRTFVKNRRSAKKTSRGLLQESKAAAPGEASSQKSLEIKRAASLPNLPKLRKLPEKTPDGLVPSSGSGGIIKQHKKEMADKAAE